MNHSGGDTPKAAATNGAIGLDLIEAGGSTRPTVPLQVESAPAPCPQRTSFQFSMILISLYLVLFIGALDQTIIATSLPRIASDLGSAIGYTWVGSAYLLASAATGPVWTKFSDIWGRKPALLSAVVLFAIGSLVAALSNSARTLIAARALQGTASGGLARLVSITFADLFSVRKRALYLGIREIVWALAGTAGPLLGGALTQYASWRWNFWINLPVCVMAFAILFVFLDVHNPRTSLQDGIKAFDWLGSILIIGITMTILLGLDFGGVEYSWSSATVLCLIIFGCSAVGIFIYVERSISSNPLIPLRIFRNLNANISFGIGFLNSMVYIAYPYYIPLYLQSAKALSSFQSGLMILPLIICGTAAGFLSGAVIHRTGRYIEFIWSGLALTLLATGLLTTLSSTTSLAVVGLFEAIGGISLAMLFQAPSLVIQNSVSQQDTAASIATNGLIQGLSTAISLVLGSVMFQNGMNSRVGQLQAAGLNETYLQAFSGSQAAASVSLIQGISDSNQMEVVKEVYSGALRNMWIMYVCLAGASVLLSWCIKHVDLKTEHVETKTGLRKDNSLQPGQV